MGSYTANYQLYMAAAAEQGWGDLVAENFETIDTKIKESMDAAAAATKTAEWANISGKPSTYPSSWSQILGKPATYPAEMQYKGVPLVVEKSSSFTLSGSGTLEFPYGGSPVYAEVGFNGYGFGSPVTIGATFSAYYQPDGIGYRSNGSRKLGTAVTSGTAYVTLPVSQRIDSLFFYRNKAAGTVSDITGTFVSQTFTKSTLAFADL